ncbi:MAG: diaminopropionate ammonia-lyase [Acidaminococcaceae bacterium]|nr:diaminopropionate ammonia-lyase [Acidaminococcaceae bacterium]
MYALTLEMVKNRATRADRECLLPFAPAMVKKVRSFHHSMWGYYHPTPLKELKNLAEYLGVKKIFVKDESERFGLKAFKALGASYAIASYISKTYGTDLSFDAVAAEALGGQAAGLTFATTTDGNHGRAVAWICRLLGFPAVIYMPKGSLPERVEAIRKEGALVKVSESNYDVTVRQLARDAAVNGWVVVQDTAWSGYTEIPLTIMQGYSTMIGEALEEMPEVPTHVFAQSGVGSMAAAVQGVLAASGSSAIFTVLEAAAANCVFRSMESGSPSKVTGDLDTIMAGLACGEVNPLAWTILHNYSDYCLSCRDEVAALGMRLWGNPLGDDPRIIAGESGAIGGGMLGFLDKYHNLKTDLGLNKESVLLLFNTEGDTAPTSYKDIVWGGKYPAAFRLEK